MGLRDSILGNIGSTMEEEQKRRSEVKVPKNAIPKVIKESGIVEAAPKSDFKSLRHLIEYLILKSPDIRFNQTELIAKKTFPGQAYDTGMFMMVKLQWVRNRYLMYAEELKRQVPEAFLATPAATPEPQPK